MLNYLTREGDETDIQNNEKINYNNIHTNDVVLDSLGNEIKVIKTKILTAREKKKIEKKKKERREQGLPSNSDEEF